LALVIGQPQGSLPESHPKLTGLNMGGRKFYTTARRGRPVRIFEDRYCKGWANRCATSHPDGSIADKTALFPADFDPLAQRGHDVRLLLRGEPDPHRKPDQA
jgi:hypothetical protein